MADSYKVFIATTVVETGPGLSVEELCRGCGCEPQWLVELVREGVLEPQGPGPEQWRFSGASLRRVRIAWHLARDLQLNMPGVALALELLEEIDSLRVRLGEPGR